MTTTQKIPGKIDTINLTTSQVSFKLAQPADSIRISYIGIDGPDEGNEKWRRLAGSELTSVNKQIFPIGGLVPYTTYFLRLFGIDKEDSIHVTHSDTLYYDPDFINETSILEDFDEMVIPNSKIFQNYPNPFNSFTNIRYQLSQTNLVQLDILDISGQQIKSLVKSSQEPGSYEVTWDGTNDQGNPVGTGIYLTRLQVGEFTDVRKMLLVK